MAAGRLWRRPESPGDFRCVCTCVCVCVVSASGSLHHFGLVNSRPDPLSKMGIIFRSGQEVCIVYTYYPLSENIQPFHVAYN